MTNLLMLLIAASGSPFCGCTTAVPAQHSIGRPSIVVYRQPAKTDFRLCKDGRVLVFPVGHPRSCN